MDGVAQESKDNPIAVKLGEGKHEVKVVADTVEREPQELQASVTVTVKVDTKVRVEETGEVKLEPTK